MFCCEYCRIFTITCFEEYLWTASSIRFYFDTINLNQSGFRLTCSFKIIVSERKYCHLFMYSRKRSPRDCVIKLRDKRTFQVSLWIKNSFKSIDFDLAKHALISPPTQSCTGWVNFDWSGSYEITAYVFIVVVMYSEETAPCNSFSYS